MADMMTSWNGTFSSLMAICVGNSPASSEFPAQRPVTWSFDVFFDLCLNKRLRKQSWGWWFKTLSRPLWRHCNEMISAFRMNPKVGGSSSHGSKHFVSHKLWHFDRNIRPWVENECHCLWTVDISNFIFSNKYTYIICKKKWLSRGMFAKVDLMHLVLIYNFYLFADENCTECYDAFHKHKHQCVS